MIEYSQVRRDSEEGGRKAKRNGKKPHKFTRKEYAQLYDKDTAPLARIPFVGDYVPAGMEQVQTYFVDSSGFGGANEPAMPIIEFMRRVTVAPHAWSFAIIERGQFQIYIAAFAPIPKE